ncbi:MAG: MFS transporter [Oleibacter sp.]|nr:MFS transporter [Thalassolituus sp.]
MTVSSRFALFYGLYFALLGCIAPYWGLYLQHLQFSSEDIGWLMAVFSLIRILAPDFWASQAHRFHSSQRMLRYVGVLTLLFFSAVFWADGVWKMAVVMVLYGFFWAAMLPQYEALCMQSLNNDLNRYSRLRLWGSIGFIASVVALGGLIQNTSVAALPAVMWVLIAWITYNGWTMGERSLEPRPDNQNPAIWPHILKRTTLGFLLATVLLQISFGPYYTFFSIYLEQQGYSSWMTGLLWAVGVFAEVLLFWQFGRIMHLMSWRSWMVASLLITAIRWCLTGYAVHSLWWLVALQTLHAFSFAALHAVSMQYIHQLFPSHLRGRGQAWYSGIGFGLGGAIGAYVSGQYWEELGGALVFTGAGIVALLAVPLVWVCLSEKKIVAE